MDRQNFTGIGKLSRKRLSEVIRRFKSCFKAQDVADCLQVSRSKAQGLLALWAKTGWIQRIHPGVYLPMELAAESSEDIVIDPWVIALQLYPPCYIGGWSACKYWGFTDQIFNSVVVLTSKRIKTKKTNRRQYNLFNKKARFRQAIWSQNNLERVY